MRFRNPRRSSRFTFNLVVSVTAVIAASLALTACDDIEVADFNPEFRPVPTIERAPTIETAPTATQFEGFKQAPTATQFEGFKQAPTVTQFEGFNDDEDTNPCTTYLDNPTPQNAKSAAEWAINYLEAAGDRVDRNNPEHIVAACQAVLTNLP